MPTMMSTNVNISKVMQIACSCGFIEERGSGTFFIRSICSLGLVGEVVHRLFSEVLLHSDPK